MTQVYDCIVVGSGAGGLAAAARLGKQGRSTLLLEAGRDFGGMLNPFTRGRYHFDVGVHYVGQAGPGRSLRKFLDRLGLESFGFEELDPDCIDRYVWDGYETKLVKGRERWIDGLVRDFPKDEKGLRRVGDILGTFDQVLKATEEGMKFSTLAKLVSSPVEIWKLLHETYGSFLTRHIRDPHARAALAGMGGDIGLPPGRASAAYSLALINHYLDGAYYPRGGGGGLRDALVGVIDAAGVERRNKAVVDALVKEGEHWTVTVDGQSFRARTIISNVDAVDTVGMVRGTDVPTKLQNKASRMRPSLGTVSVFIGTRLDLGAAGLGSGNLWHYGTHDIDGLYEPLFRGELPDSSAFFISSSSLKDPTTKRAPPGCHTLELVSFAPSAPFQPWFDQAPMRRGPAYQSLKQQVTERLLAGAERYLPGLSNSIEVLETASPATVWSYVRGRGGGIYGPEHSPDQSIVNRFQTRSGIPGLYFAGASVLGCGVNPCLSSGSSAAKAVDEDLSK